MITQFLIQALLLIPLVVIAPLPEVTTLNIFGIDVDQYLVQGRGYLEFLLDYIPILSTVLSVFTAVLSFEALLLVLKFFKLVR